MTPTALLLAALSASAGPDQSVFLPTDEAGVPGGQTHPDGRVAPAPLGFWIPTWTQVDPKRPQVLVETAPVDLDAGTHRVVAQLWHRSRIGARLATLTVHAAGGDTDFVVKARDFDAPLLGGMQTVTFPFETPARGPVSVSVTADGGRRVHVGAIRLADDAPRPVYAIRHCTNSRVKLRSTRAANAVELDVRWREGRVAIGHPEPNPAPCRGASAEGEDAALLLGTLGARLRGDRRPLALAIVDVKSPEEDTVAYATGLAQALAAARIPPERVVLSIPVTHAPTFVAALADAGFTGSRLDAWYDIGDGPVPTDWIDVSVAAGSDFLGVGADPVAFWRPTPTWAAALKNLVDRRERDGTPASVYFWTVERGPSYRFALDAGVDGIITNHPRRLTALLGRRPYRTLAVLAEDPPPRPRGRTALSENP